MSSRNEMALSASITAPYVCPLCPTKAFARLCDLNKHSKSHSRPYKCEEPDCKYGTLGWPTAKELERHHNDKHSASPRTFPCLFPPCPYWSKRESNCKQHMEKAHKWVYVRSKAIGRRSAAQPKLATPGRETKVCDKSSRASHTPAAIPASLQVMSVPPPGLDFILFDDDQADAMGEDDDSLCHAYGDSDGAESYLPWTSPSTRLRKNELFIEMFSQAYNNAHDETTLTMDADHAEVSSMLPAPQTPQDTQVGATQADGHSPFVDNVAIKIEPPTMAAGIKAPRKRKYEPVEVNPSSSGRRPLPTRRESNPDSRKADPGQAVPALTTSRALPPHEDGPSDDSLPPKKKLKPNPVDGFTDTSMPDIFRHAHPQIYDRDRTDRYSPCHTVHKEISTLVRHLSRPAHRLTVTDRIISSFDIEDPGFKHPRAGVCRRCWQTFGDRQAFDAHLAHSCTKVSRGKREKWRVLFDTFTPLLDFPNHAPSSTQPTERIEEADRRTLFGDLGASLIPDDDDDDDAKMRIDAGTPPTSVPSPALLSSAGFLPLHASGGRFIPADEHQRLQEQHHTLRERHQQLEQVAQVLLAREIIQERLRHGPAAMPDTSSSALGTSKSTLPDRSSDGSDRDSLLQHMDSQSTEVDVDRFMEEMEDTRQSLSRMNSGLSTASRSTIHRVPPSPPPRNAQLPAHDNAASTSQQAKHGLAHRPPPPSIPDSGYGTEERRGSLGELPPGAGTQAVTAPMTPPSSAEKPQQDPTIGQGITWGASPFQKTVTASAQSPPHSQQLGFLGDQETAHYEDASFHLFYPENISQSRASPPGFTFDYSSQLE